MEKRFFEIYEDLLKLFAPREDFSGIFGATSSKCLQETFVRMHQKLKTDLSLEIGAHGAEYSIRVHDVYGDGISVCAVEGSQKTHRYFSAKENFEARNIAYIHSVVSSTDGEIDFYEYQDENTDRHSGISSIHIHGTGHGASRSRATVRSVRGDTLIAAKYPDKESIALWIDVEGAQEEVLSSFSDNFRTGRINSLYIEVESEKFWPAQSMLDADIIRHMRRFNFIPFLRDNEYGAQYNILFVNKKVLSPDYEVFYDYYMALLWKEMNVLASAKES